MTVAPPAGSPAHAQQAPVLRCLQEYTQHTSRQACVAAQPTIAKPQDSRQWANSPTPHHGLEITDARSACRQTGPRAHAFGNTQNRYARPPACTPDIATLVCNTYTCATAHPAAAHTVKAASIQNRGTNGHMHARSHMQPRVLPRWARRPPRLVSSFGTHTSHFGRYQALILKSAPRARCRWHRAPGDGHKAPRPRTVCGTPRRRPHRYSTRHRRGTPPQRMSSGAKKRPRANPPSPGATAVAGAGSTKDAGHQAASPSATPGPADDPKTSIGATWQRGRGALGLRASGRPSAATAAVGAGAAAPDGARQKIRLPRRCPQTGASLGRPRAGPVAKRRRRPASGRGAAARFLRRRPKHAHGGARRMARPPSQPSRSQERAPTPPLWAAGAARRRQRRPPACPKTMPSRRHGGGDRNKPLLSLLLFRTLSLRPSTRGICAMGAGGPTEAASSTAAPLPHDVVDRKPIGTESGMEWGCMAPTATAPRPPGGNRGRILQRCGAAMPAAATPPPSRPPAACPPLRWRERERRKDARVQARIQLGA